MFASADGYDRFMGRYSIPLATRFADFAGVETGQRVLDVGCGPGALIGELVPRVGPSSVSAVDPSETFVAAARDRYPEVDVEMASAEKLPYDSRTFDTVLAQLVVHFMEDPVTGLVEMGRVTRPGGVVSACVWDHGGGQGPLAVFWEAVRSMDASAPDESERPGTRRGHLAMLFRDAGLTGVEDGALAVEVTHPSFEAWWAPFTLGVGPAGAHVGSLDREERVELEERCRRLLPEAPFTISATAWAALGRV